MKKSQKNNGDHHGCLLLCCVPENIGCSVLPEALSPSGEPSVPIWQSHGSGSHDLVGG